MYVQLYCVMMWALDCDLAYTSKTLQSTAAGGSTSTIGGSMQYALLET